MVRGGPVLDDELDRRPPALFGVAEIPDAPILDPVARRGNVFLKASAGQPAAPALANPMTFGE